MNENLQCIGRKRLKRLLSFSITEPQDATISLLPPIFADPNKIQVQSFCHSATNFLRPIECLLRISAAVNLTKHKAYYVLKVVKVL